MYEGFVDNIQKQGLISGWIRKSAIVEAKDEPIAVLLMLADQVVGEAVVGHWRDDLGGSFGFRISHDKEIGASDYLLGRVKIIAKTKTMSQDLRIWEGALAKIGISSAACSETQNSLRGAFAAIDLPVGFISTNQVTIVGKEGYLFVYQGGNRMADSYFMSPDDQAVVDATARWMNVFSSRSKTLDRMGITFLQFIIPEKSSVLRELYPLPIPRNNAFHVSLMKEIKASPIRSKVDDFGNLLDFDDLRKLYTKGNSHFSFEGNLLILNTMLRKLGLKPVSPFNLTWGIAAGSDLGAHLFGRSFLEEGLIAENVTGFLDESRLQLEIVKEVPGHYGAHRVWRNSGAINKLKVVAFGNSYFELGVQKIVCLGGLLVCSVSSILYGQPTWISTTSTKSNPISS